MLTICDKCGNNCIAKGSATGYGVDDKGNKLCYPCCAQLERDQMDETGKIILYLDEKNRKVTNWTGELSYSVRSLTKHKDNKGATAYFRDHNDNLWCAVRRGDMDACRARKCKGR